MKYRLEELVDLQIGRTPPRKEFEWFNTNGEGYKWVSIKDMGNSGRFISDTSEYLTEAAQKRFGIPIVEKGTLLLSFKLTVGRLCITTDRMLTNEAIAQLPIKDANIVDRDFLYYYLKNYNFHQLGSTSSIATAINSTYLKKMEIDLPPIDQQRAIAAVLSSIDDKIESNNAINNNLEQQAFALFDSLFPRTIDGSQAIGDYINPIRGRNLLSKDAVYGTVPVVAGGLEPSTYHNVANTKAPVLTISASGANAGFVNLWLNPVWSSDSSYIDSSMTPNVFFWYILLKGRQKEIFDAQTGSAQPHIYPQHIAAMPVGDLNQELVSQFTTQVAPLFELIGANKDENERLRNIRDALLPRLMSGEIDVSDICI